MSPKKKPEPEPEPVEQPEPEPELPVAEVVPQGPIVEAKPEYHRPQKPMGTDHEGRAFRNWLTEYMAWAQHPNKIL